MRADKHTREQVEIERSAFEAEQTPDGSLVTGEANVARYLNPPRDTVYPLEYAYALLGDVRGRWVLDFGCGTGENTLLLARRGANVIGVDISCSLIRIAQRRLSLNNVPGGAQFIVGSAHDLPLADESVDVVLGVAILHHLDLGLATREIHRVLKPGGRAIFKEPVRDSQLLRAVRKCIPYRTPNVSPFERPLTAAEIDSFRRPFRTSSVRAFSLPFVHLTKVVRPLRRHHHSAHRWDGAILKRMPALTPFTAIRVVELTK
jgi:SAM-dependent methyltransferase